MQNDSIISHVSLGTNDFKKAKTFYTELLLVIGAHLIDDIPEYEWVSFGKKYPEFWVGKPENGEVASVGNGIHVSFMVDTKEKVDAFYKKAVELGAVGEGEPGPREDYGAGYYGAFVRDLDGNKIEAMHWDESA